MRSAIVFGASGSIGSEICTHFKKQGYQVLEVGRNQKSNQVNAPHAWFKWDGNSEEFAKAIKHRLGPKKIDALVWAQGMNFNDDIDHFNLSKHLDMYEANVTFILSTLDVLMKASLLDIHARLCVISSIWQNIARQSKLSYCITKSALQGLVQSLSIDLGRQGKLINAVLPGALDTTMTRANLSQEQIAELELATPFGSLPNLSDVKGLVSYLCSLQHTGISGQFIAADRGLSYARIL